MAYRLKHSETVPENVKRIAGEEIGSAMDALRGKGVQNGDDAVHETRKSLKRARALIRLVRDELGDFFSDANVILRHTGHQLSDLRDAGALLGVVDGLRKSMNGNGSKESVAAVREMLLEQKRHLEKDAVARKLKPQAAAALQPVRKAIAYWPLKTDGFACIEPGLEKTFRDGRKALAQARKSGSREDFHEWRKRAKDHWYQVRLLEKVWSDLMTGYEQSLKELEDALGEDLNLAILSERVQTLAVNGSSAKFAPLMNSIESSRQELRKRALEIGERVYSAKPREFVRQMKRLWKAW